MAGRGKKAKVVFSRWTGSKSFGCSGIQGDYVVFYLLGCLLMVRVLYFLGLWFTCICFHVVAYP